MPASYLKRGKELHCSVICSATWFWLFCAILPLLCNNSESWSSFVKKILRKEDIKIVVLRCFLIGFNDTKFEKARWSWISLETILRRQPLVINRKLVAIVFYKSITQAVHTNYIEIKCCLSVFLWWMGIIPQQHKKCLLGALDLNTLFEGNYCHNHWMVGGARVGVDLSHLKSLVPRCVNPVVVYL